jgi:regulator of nonsense transcripts 1
MIKIHPENFIVLKKQYRMNPELSKFSSDFFYDKTIKNSSKHEENKYIKKIFKKFCWPRKDIPIMFININNKTTLKYRLNLNNKNNGKQDNYSIFERNMGKSYENELEANITVKIINMINEIKSYKKGKYNIGIITPYIGQKKLILEKLYLNDKDKDFDYYNNNIINVASVDSFQGKEKDFIIINTVKSNYKNFIGFLKDPRRLNVSLTRAKHGLIIIGDAFCLSNSIGEFGNKYSIWRYLIKYYQDLGVIVDYNDGEKGQTMFTPTKIFKDEILDKYNFQEYDYNIKDNKPNINRDYIDNYEYINNRFQHYFDDRKYDNNELLNDNNFLYDDYYEDITEPKNHNYNYDNNYYYKDNFNYNYCNKYNRDDVLTIDDYYNINNYNINNTYKDNTFNHNNYYYNRHSNVQSNYINNYDNHFFNYKKDY